MRFMTKRYTNRRSLLYLFFSGQMGALQKSGGTIEIISGALCPTCKLILLPVPSRTRHNLAATVRVVVV